jgi:K+-transporting ATPase A subunit
MPQHSKSEAISIILPEPLEAVVRLQAQQQTCILYEMNGIANQNISSTAGTIDNRHE